MKIFNIVSPDYRSFIKKIFSLIHSDATHLYFHLNAENLNIAIRDPEFFSILNQPDATVILEGIGPVWAARIKGFSIPERICITDLILQLLNDSRYRKTNPGIFFLGGKQGAAMSAQTNLKEKFPFANFVGSHHGYFKDDVDVIQLINKSKPKILFVGLGCPAQEKWIHNHKGELDVPVIFSCGGKFDYYATNRIKRAPLWMQRMGLEWLHRFLLEPRRLWKRYTIGLIKFLFSFPRYSFRIKKL